MTRFTNCCRKFDLVAFDVDGTLVDDTVFVWQTLHDYFCTDPASRQHAFNSYMTGQSTYAEWFAHDMKLLIEAGAMRDSMLSAINGMKLTKGAIETLEALRRRGVKLAILSGSLDIVVEKFGLAPYFDDIYINRIKFDEFGRVSSWKPTAYDVHDKGAGLREIASKHSISMERTAFVGDNFNDIEAARAAGFSIAFNCKSEELARVASVVVPGGDLQAILPFLLD